MALLSESGAGLKLLCFFVSDLHGRRDRYRKLFREIEAKPPAAVFLGGDLFPSGMFSFSRSDGNTRYEFVDEFLLTELFSLKKKLAGAYPRIFFIPGNDDSQILANYIKKKSKKLLEHIDCRKVSLRDYSIYGYSFVPPTPFMLKDREKYDMGQFVDPGCIPPEEGFRTVPVPKNEILHSTISRDLKALTLNADLSRAIFLFHSPPYKTNLDRAALDGKLIDHVPLDVHCGSTAIRKFIEDYKPMLTLHGHIHESARITGSWKDKIGRTLCFSAAHDGPELALVTFDLSELQKASRNLI